MRNLFVAAALAALTIACSAGTTLRRELGPTPQQQILELEARVSQCEARRAEAERELGELRRTVAEREGAAPRR